MNNILDDFKEEDSSIHTGNVFSKILTKPRATLSFILNRKPPDLYVPQLLIAGAFVNALEADSLIYGQLLTIITTLIFTTALGFVLYYVYAWAIKATGVWLGGETTARKCRTVLAWSAVPTLINVLFIMILYFMKTSNYFYYNQELYQVLTLGISIFQIGLSIWGLVISVIGISLAQGFGYGKAFINILIPLLFFILFGFLFFMIFSSMIS